MKTEQTGSRQKPGPFDDVLALIVTCVGCKTQRSFKVSDSFGVTITRQSSGMAIKSWCTKCGREIAVQLCWTQRHKGWTVEQVDYEDAVTVADEFGLEPIEGKRTV